MDTDDPTTVPTSEPTLPPTMEPTTGEPTMDPDALAAIPAIKLQTLSSDDVDAGALGVALAVIGGMFVLTVIVSCRLWVLHERKHRPLYFQRQQQILKARNARLSGAEQEDTEMAAMTTAGRVGNVYGAGVDP